MSSPISSRLNKRKKKELYDGYVKVALVEVSEIFDRPCGQRLEPMLKKQVDNLRDLGELLIPDEVAEKLKKIAPATIDRKLRHEKEGPTSEEKIPQEKKSSYLSEDTSYSCPHHIIIMPRFFKY